MTTRAAGINLTAKQLLIYQALLEIFSPQKAKQFIIYMKKKAASKAIKSTTKPTAKMPMDMKKKSKKKC